MGGHISDILGFPEFRMRFDRRKFRSQTSDNMDRWKAEQGRGREKRKSQKKEDTDARKGGKVAIHCVFQMICGSGGSKSRLAKAAGAEPAGQMRDEKLHAVVARSTFPSQNVQNTPVSDHFWTVAMSKKCTPLWREAHFQVKMYKTHQCRTTFGSCDVEKVDAVVARSTFPKCKMYKTHQCRTTFGSCDVEKVDAVVARSTFPSQNVQNTPVSNHFWKLRCRKSARRCGAKHISKSKCTKHTKCRTTFGSCDVEKVHGAKHISKSKCTKHHMFAPLLEVRMLKKCTSLWREAHFEVKMYKTLGVRTTFGSSDVASLRFGSLHYTIHSTTLQYITLHSTTLQLQLQNYTTTLHYTPLHQITIHYATLHYTPLHYATLLYTIHSTTLHYITLHYTLHTLQYITLHYTPQHYNYNYRTTLHYTPLH